MSFFYRSVIVLSLLALLLFAYLVYSETGNLEAVFSDYRNLAITWVLVQAAGWAVLGTNKLLNLWFSWQQKTVLRFSLGLLADTIVASVVFFGLLAAGFYLKNEADELNYLMESKGELITKTCVLFFFTAFTFTIIDFAWFSYRQYAVVQIQKVQTLRNQLELQYEMLKSQLSPHYLFNSLNTISALLYRDVELTEEFIRNFARTYQYVLETNSKKLVRLEQELAFIRSYIFLLKVRFDESLRVQIDLPKSVYQSQIPPLTLQLLIENAVKHNVITEGTPLNITISLDEKNHLLVKNNKTAQPNEASSFKIGLANIKKRYSYFSTVPVKTVNEHFFSVTLPILNIDNKKRDAQLPYAFFMTL